MGELIPLDDGYGVPVGTRYELASKFSGSHVVYAEQSRLVVEWYDHGDHAPYESANLLIFEREAQLALLAALDLAPMSPNDLAVEITRRFESYFEVRTFADERGVTYERKVDFQP